MDQEDTAGIYARESSVLGRYVQIGMAGGRVIAVSFPETVNSTAVASDSIEVLDRVFAYLDGQKEEFADVDTGLTVPTDHRAVLESTRKIPYGTTVDIDQLARTAGLEDDTSTARKALANNPVPLVIPDHRVRDAPSGAPPAVEQQLQQLEKNHRDGTQ